MSPSFVDRSAVTPRRQRQPLLSMSTAPGRRATGRAAPSGSRSSCAPCRRSVTLTPASRLYADRHRVGEAAAVAREAGRRRGVEQREPGVVVGEVDRVVEVVDLWRRWRPTRQAVPSGSSARPAAPAGRTADRAGSRGRRRHWKFSCSVWCSSLERRPVDVAAADEAAHVLRRVDLGRVGERIGRTEWFDRPRAVRTLACCSFTNCGVIREARCTG